jgi:hypothetical protein
MSSIVYISKLNPIKFVDLNPTEVPQYLSKHLDDYRLQDQQFIWNQQVFYNQKWQLSDIIYLQFIANMNPISMDVIDCYDISRLNFNANLTLPDKFNPGFNAYQIACAVNTLSEGIYFLKLTFGSKTCISEPLEIKQVHKNTLLLEYKHNRAHDDVIFETGIKFGFRVEGIIGAVKPGSKDTLYEDTPLNPSVISSIPYNSFTLKIGGSRGVPDWIVEKWNHIWTCSTVTIDGKEFAKDSESKAEYKEADRYPLRGIQMDVREGINRSSKIISPDVDPNIRLAVVYNIEGHLFGDISTNAGSNVIPINDIE